MELNVENVTNIMKYGLFKDEELVDGKPQGDVIKVAGIMRNFGFHPRIEEKKSDIQQLINQLNPTFKEGWTFLNLAFDKNDRHWGEHPNCEDLYAIASAVGLARFSLPAEFWDALPGGVPYIAFDIN